MSAPLGVRHDISHGDRASAAQRGDQGQALIVSLVFLTVLLGMAAAVLDVGSWFREDRALQASVDAAALAGAQALPYSPGEATALALDYAGKNGGGIDAGAIDFEAQILADDTIVVRGEREAPGFFTKVFGVDSVDVHATAKARAGTMSAARWVAPIVVNEQHPMLQCGCFGDGYPTEIALANLHQPGSGNAAGAFALLELDSGSGTAGESTVAGWMAEGYEGFMPLGIYNSVPSTMWNGGAFQNAFNLRVGDEVLFPVYRPPIVEGGSTAEFDIIGWVGFHITGSSGGGSSARVEGWFTKIIWEGIQGDSPGPDFGARAIMLVE